MIKVIVLLVSIHMCTRTIASLYGLSDHRYRINQAWFTILLKILIWILAPFALYVVLPSEFAPFVLYGYGFFIVFHILIYWVGQYCRMVFERKL